jgi:alcohol dehydrogenase/L-iditol 2-dehydrogenase
VELREFARPVPGAEDVILAVEAVGVCGSDLHQWTGQHSWPVNYPVVLGHEFGGRIAELGAGVRGWSEGDRVVSETAAVVDPASPLTRAGRYNLDPRRKGFGYGVDGAMTRFVRVPARCLHRVPDGLPLEQAALTEPCCVAYNAVIENGRVQPGDRIRDPSASSVRRWRGSLGRRSPSSVWSGTGSASKWRGRMVAM